ncbi:MAG: hypothetical protein WCI02_12370 [Planctomycetota bacterium]
MPSKSEQRMRRIAIVLQSMDANSAKTLLAGFPSDTARSIRSVMSRLTGVTSDERSDAFNELNELLERDRITNPSTTTKVKNGLDCDRQPPTLASPASESDRPLNTNRHGLGQRGGDSENLFLSFAAHRSHPKTSPTHSPSVPTERDGTSSIPPTELSAELIAASLSAERPLVIATAIQYLPLSSASELIHRLPRDKATQALGILPNLQHIDPEVAWAIDQELRSKQIQPSIQNTANQAGREKLQAILASLPQNEQQEWNTAISKITSPETEPPPTNQSEPRVHLTYESMQWHGTLLARPFHSDARRSYEEASEPLTTIPFSPLDEAISTTQWNAVAKDASSEETNAPSTLPIYGLHLQSNSRSFEELLELEDEDLVRLLHANDPQTVLRALAHGSPRFLGRIEKLLPATEIPRFRSCLIEVERMDPSLFTAARDAVLEQADALVASGALPPYQTLTRRLSA